MSSSRSAAHILILSLTASACVLDWGDSESDPDMAADAGRDDGGGPKAPDAGMSMDAGEAGAPFAPPDAGVDGGVDAAAAGDASFPDGSIPDGDGGAGGEYAIGTLGSPCASELEQTLACAGHASLQPVVCEDGEWKAMPKCEATKRCDSTPGPSQGACATVPAECVGHDSGPVCAGQDRKRCGIDLTSVFDDVPCPQDASCTGQGVCGCDPGFLDDGLGGCANKSDCPEFACLPGVCADGIQSYTCTCGAGLTGTGTQACGDVDECATSNGGCDTSPLATCVNRTAKAPTCSCPTPFAGNGVGENGCAAYDCENDIDCKASLQIAAVRDAINAGKNSVVLSSLPVNEAIVTYVNENGTFYIQNRPHGPAIVVLLDAATAAPDGPIVVGDRLNIIVTLGGNGGWAGSPVWIDAASISHAGSSATLPAAQDLTEVKLLPLPSAPWMFESELATLSATLVRRFAGEWMLATAGEPSGGYDVRLQLSSELDTLLGLVPGCKVRLNPLPASREGAAVTFRITKASQVQFALTDCPPLKLVASRPVRGATSFYAEAPLSLTFSEPPAASSLSTQVQDGVCTGSIQLSADGFASCRAFSSSAPAFTSDSSVTLTPKVPLAADTAYELKITEASTTLNGRALEAEVRISFRTALNVAREGLVISQLYASGGNNGATYTNDFIQLHNTGVGNVDLTGLTLQYQSATGSTWSVAALNSAVLPGGGYFLIQGQGGQTGMPLPTPDQYVNLNLGSTGGKLAIVNTGGALAAGCPTGSSIVDVVGYGTAGCFEGRAPAALGTPAQSVHRFGRGCFDTDDNANDFTVGAPELSSSGSSTYVCGAPP